VQVTAGSCDAGMSERGLYQVKGSAAIESMGSVRMPKPMRRNQELDPGAQGGLPDDPQDG